MATFSGHPTRTPVPLTALLVPRPWGGRRLARLAPSEPPAGPIGEAWFAAPGSHEAEVARQHGEPFVGHVPFARHGARLPLLAKLLDAAEALSVQVHPDDAYAERVEAHTGHLGKAEAWLILDAEPDAYVLWGWTRTVDADEVRAAVAAGCLTELLRRLPVRAGDVIVNEPGVVHALGPGILVYELQQASDLTYRLYDHGRRDARGRPRALHLGQALDVARLTPSEACAPPRPLAPGRERLAATSAFELERWRVGRDGAPAEQAWQVEPRSLELWTVLAGEARLVSGAAEISLGQYASVLLPAGVGAARWRGNAVLARGRV